MAKRLTEEDIRRIFREEVERDREQQAILESIHPETYKVWEKTQDLPVRFGVEMVQQIIDTYWEVVEDGLNER